MASYPNQEDTKIPLKLRELLLCMMKGKSHIIDTPSLMHVWE